MKKSIALSSFVKSIAVKLLAALMDEPFPLIHFQGELAISKYSISKIDSYFGKNWL
jgi:hypothetical protein